MAASFFYNAQGRGFCTIVGDSNIVRFFPDGHHWDPKSPVTESRPSPEEWETFWSLAESLDVWNWQGDYGQHIICGTPWSLELEREGKVLSCSGNGKGDAAPPGFARLYQAMKELARDH